MKYHYITDNFVYVTTSMPRMDTEALTFPFTAAVHAKSNTGVVGILLIECAEITLHGKFECIRF